MLDSFVKGFTEINDTLLKEDDPKFFGKDFSFFSSDPIIFYNTEKDVIVYANNMFSTEFNYSVEDLAAWNYSIYPLLSEEHKETFRQALRPLLEGNAPALDNLYSLVNKSNDHQYYRLKLRNLHKNYYYIQFERAAKLALPMLKNRTADDLVSNAEAMLKFGFWMWDAATGKFYFTNGMYGLLGYDARALPLPDANTAWQRAHELQSDARADFERQAAAAAATKDSYEVKTTLKDANGNLLTVIEHGKILLDEAGELKGVSGLTNDISAQDQNLKSLAEYRDMMVENERLLNFGSWESDLDGTRISWSDGMYKLFGYDDQDKSSVRVNRDLYARHIKGNEFFGKALEKNLALLSEKGQYQWDYEIKDNKGTVRMLSTFGKLVRDGQQQLEKIIGTTRDVTELRGYERMLENKIAELNRSNRELEEFAYVASHDLQEPLRKISTFSQRLHLKYANKLGEDGNLYISRVVVACDNMRKLIDNLLEFSRISLNSPPPQQEDLNKIVHQALEELDLVIAETNAVIQVDQLPNIEAVSSQILQLFVNLLNNSIKFRKENEPLKIVIKSRQLSPAEVDEFDLTAEVEYFLITVEDNGIGFEQQYARRIFQLFQRLEGKSEYPGTGIGLSICKKIVVNHKGLIFASGEPGKGAVFSVILPQFQ